MLSTVEFSRNTPTHWGFYARAEGFEPSPAALETDMLTVNTTPASIELERAALPDSASGGAALVVC